MYQIVTAATSPEVRDQGATVAVLPVGSFEQHGPYLPLTTDTIISSAIARRLADDHRLLLLPPITFSCSHEHAVYPGTVSISTRTLIAVVEDIAASLRTAGIQRLVVVNGHGGNYVLSNVVQEANTSEARMLLFPGRADWTRAREHAEMQTSHSEDMHAGELEVSVLLHVTPDQVRDGYRDADHLADDRPHLFVSGMSAYTDTGIIGRPSLGTAEKGRLLLDSLSDSFKAHLALLT